MEKTQTPLQEMLELQREIERNIAEIEAKLRTAQELVEAHQKSLRTFFDLRAKAASLLRGFEPDQNTPLLYLTPTDTETQGGIKRARATGNPKKEAVAAASRKIIEIAGRPLSRTELFLSLMSAGISLNGKNPEMVLSTMLWRAGAQAGVVRLETGGYWRSDMPVPKSGQEAQDNG